jgi:hypothetical protein
MKINLSGEEMEIADIIASQAVIHKKLRVRFPRPDGPCRYWH